MMQELFALLVESAARTAAVAAAAGLGLMAFRVRDAATRWAVWMVVLAAGLLMPLAVTLNPRVALVTVPAAAAETAMAEAMDVALELPEFAAAPAPRPVNWTAIAVCSYCAVAAALLLRVAAGLWWTWRLRRRGTLEAGFPVPVFSSEDVDVPVTVGMVRPAVILPAGWRQWDPRKTEAVLLHEFAHVERGDFLVQLAASVHAAVFWFSPVAWWLRRQILTLAEESADDRAVRSLGDAPFYAEVVFSFLGRKPVRSAAVAMARGSRAEARIDRILAGGSAAGVVPAKAVALIAALGVPVLFLTSAITWAQAPPPLPPPAPIAPLPEPAPVRPPRPVAVPQPPAPPRTTAQVSPVPPTPPMPAPSPEAAPEPAPGPPAPPARPRPPRPPRVRGNRGEGNLRLSGNAIHFDRGGKRYIVDDAALVAQARELFHGVHDLAAEQRALGAQQRALSAKQRELAKSMQSASMPIGDLTADIDRIRAEADALRGKGSVTQREMHRLQSLVGRLQRQIAELQSKMGGDRSAFGRMMSEFREEHAELARQQALRAEKQAEEAEQLRKMLDDAIRDGRARVQP